MNNESVETTPVEATIILVIFLLLGSFVLGVIYGLNRSRRLIQEDAVNVGCAEWVADSKGAPEFCWKSPTNVVD